MDQDAEQRLFSSLVFLADSLVSGFDVLDLSDRLVSASMDLIDVHAVGIMLDDQRGSLRVIAASTEETRLLELLELQNDTGPCLEAFRTANTVRWTASPVGPEWPAFSTAAQAQGINAAYALPMKLRDRTIGALNLFCVGDHRLSEREEQIAQVLANVTTIGILSHWTIRRQEELAEQLQTALNSRIIIEQAKGVIAERAGVSPAEAFETIRAAARGSRRPLSEIAVDIVEGRSS